MMAWYGLEIAGSIKSITYFIIFVMNLSGDIFTACANKCFLLDSWLEKYLGHSEKNKLAGGAGWT